MSDYWLPGDILSDDDWCDLDDFDDDDDDEVTLLVLIDWHDDADDFDVEVMLMSAGSHE